RTVPWLDLPAHASGSASLRYRRPTERPTDRPPRLHGLGTGRGHGVADPDRIRVRHQPHRRTAGRRRHDPVPRPRPPRRRRYRRRPALQTLCRRCPLLSRSRRHVSLPRLHHPGGEGRSRPHHPLRPRRPRERRPHHQRRSRLPLPHPPSPQDRGGMGLLSPVRRQLHLGPRTEPPHARLRHPSGHRTHRPARRPRPTRAPRDQPTPAESRGERPYLRERVDHPAAPPPRPGPTEHRASPTTRPRPAPQDRHHAGCAAGRQAGSGREATVLSQKSIVPSTCADYPRLEGDAASTPPDRSFPEACERCAAMAMTSSTYISFPGNASEAFPFYQELFGGELEVQTYDAMPSLEGFPFTPPPGAV